MDRNRAPDGGWGWVLMIGTGIMVVVSSAPLPLFGLIYGMMLENLNCTTRDVTAIVSSHSSCYGLAALASPCFIKRFSLRFVGMAGAFILVLGNLVAAFSTSFIQLLLGAGVLNGISFGLMIVTTAINFNQYFDKKRTTAMGFMQMLNMGGTTLYPLIVETLLLQYGYFGTHLILAAISAHAIFSTMLIKPHEGMSIKNYRAVSNYGTCETSTKEENELENLHLGRKLKYGKINLPDRNISWWNKITRSKYIIFLKDPKCSNMCIGVSATTFIDPAFFAMHTVYLLGPLAMPIADVKVILTVTSAGDLLARASTMVFGKWLSTLNRSLLWLAMSGTAVGIIGFALVEDYISLLLFSVILGYFRGIIWVTQSLVFAEHYNTEDFPIVLTISTVMYTAVNLIFGPLIGLIRDYTNSFLVMFMVMAGVLVVTSLLWFAELVVFPNLKKILKI